MLTARASILAACAYTNLPDAAQDAPELSDAGAADADLDADLDATVTDASAADATVSTDGGVTDLDSP